MSENIPTKNFIQKIIENDIKEGQQNLKFRFPPEPNGYLHIGHAKSIFLNYGLAEEYHGKCNLRFDDTNPSTENQEFVDSIKSDVAWLGFDLDNDPLFASDYFEKLYGFACELISKELAYVDSQDQETIKLQRGTLTKPGVNSPYRDRDKETNMQLFQQMRNGDFNEGEHVLRAKIDMESPNLNMRDPTIYRIRKSSHYRTGDKWNIFPMYDFTQCLSDAIENVTHSICTLEFEDHRPLYDWVIENINLDCRPKQIEFARLDLSFTITSKRKLLTLINEKKVNGWDDPRLPTLKGLKRRGFNPSVLKRFCKLVGVTKKDALIDISLLETCARDEFDKKAPRLMAVLDPVKVVIKNLPEDEEISIDAQNHPKDESFGTRKLKLTREIFIESTDFEEDPPKKFFRLSVGKSVRLRYGFVINCTSIEKDKNGNITTIYCDYIPGTLNGVNPEGQKIKGIIHWVSASENVKLKVNLIDRLFNIAEPNREDDFLKALNPKSLIEMKNAIGETNLIKFVSQTVQFERLGYFTVENETIGSDRLVYNRTITLRDSWGKMNEK